MVFNPKQFYREYKISLYKESAMMKDQINRQFQKIRDDPDDRQSKRKLKTMSKQFDDQRVKFQSF